MNLRNYKVYNFIPKKSFVGGETFIWTKAVYCKTNNILAVEGCFWACPFSLEFYDFSEPDNLPLNFICSTYDMENEIDIDYDVELSGWNDQGKIVMKCHVNEVETEKTLDVLVFGKQK